MTSIKIQVSPLLRSPVVAVSVWIMENTELALRPESEISALWLEFAKAYLNKNVGIGDIDNFQRLKDLLASQPATELDAAQKASMAAYIFTTYYDPRAGEFQEDLMHGADFADFWVAGFRHIEDGRHSVALSMLENGTVLI